MFKIGDKVMTGVYVGEKFQPMTTGIVVGIHSGFCDVDVMSIHGGSPWITQHMNSHLRMV